MFFAMNSVWTVVLRNWYLFRQFFVSTLIPDIADNIFWFGAFAVGVGSMVASGGQEGYVQFLVPGAILMTGLYYASSEVTFSLLPKVKAGGVWHAALSTPIRLWQLMLGELVWASLRGVISAICLFVLALVLGLVDDPVKSLWIFPCAFLSYYAFCSVSMIVTSIIKHEQLFSYMFVFWLSPALLFSGAYFKLDTLPAWAGVVVNVIPMTHSITVVREIMLEGAPSSSSLVLFLAISLLMSGLSFALAHYFFKKRLFD